MTTETPPLPLAGPLQTDFVSFPNRAGLRVAACLDHAGGDLRARPWVVLAPKYGETKKNNLQLAYHLAANGLNVLRFDHTNHVGESEGRMEDFTFCNAISDIRASMDYLEMRFGARQSVLVANSLSARPAIRVLCEDARVTALVSVVGVVHFRKTLEVVYQQDLVGDHLAGVAHGVTDILGHQVNLAHFMESCIRERLHDFEGTRRDLAAARGKMFFFYADGDVWVDPGEVRQLAAGNGRMQLREIKGAMHELRENPTGADRALKEVVHVCRHSRLAEEEELDALALPAKKLYLRQNKVERDRLRAAAPLKHTEQEFWQAYLGKYAIMEKVGDYQAYLDLVGECLGPVGAGETVFDVGCGNGLFGVWCIRDLLLRRGETPALPPVYVGLDLTHSGLTEAMQRHEAARAVSPARPAAGDDGLARIYFPFDLENVRAAGGPAHRLPFADATFDKICCSLLLSYLTRPEPLVAELHRVLRPNGTIVLSSMKPFCDLSQIYKDFVEEDHGQPDVQRARNLISAAGMIRLKEEQGHYVFYSGPELSQLLLSAGFRQPQAYRSFGDQANLVTARK